MPYTYYNTSLVRIKRACNIESAVTDFDDDLGQALQDAYHFINNALAKYTTTPLSGTVPDMIIRIESDIGGGLFKEVKTNPVEGERLKRHILRERGEAALLEYISTNYEGSNSGGAEESLYFSGYRNDAKTNIEVDDLNNEEDDYAT